MRPMRAVILLFMLHLFSRNCLAADNRIDKLKNLCINTMLVEKGIPHTVIVSPQNSSYKKLSDIIRDKIEILTGITVPVYADNHRPEDILSKYHVIALGNMTTNAFIEKMYRQWYVLLDLKYPGSGGYVIRTAHNPYGTGKNVIFIGGSDESGVFKAVQEFISLLQPGDPLEVGRLMRIKLGRSMAPPAIGDHIPDWTVYSWRDSWRKTTGGRTTGYKPSTFFGWNPISIAGILYYMTGKKEYLDYFKAMAMPRPGSVPHPNRTSDAFNDPMDPLVKNYHYRSHLVDCVWDLIEESPLFTDEERLYITNKLYEHQYNYDPDHTYSRPNGNRHALWHMMSIYTGSRYFATYYPDPAWNKRINNVRKAFNSFINNPTWGERDILPWVSTSIEPVFEFFLMDGSDAFVSSGTAGTMMHALEVLMTGNEVDDYNKYAAISLLHKAAYMLDDTRYIWMARQLGFDFKVFRIGQSYWPRNDLPIKEPVDLIDNMSIYPLAKTTWKKTGRSIILDEGFQLLAYRTGLTKWDDYFLVDGFFGGGRSPYHLNSIYKLRMFNGRMILDGYLNDVDIWYNGMVEPWVARSAALKNSFSDENLAYIKSEVPNMPSSIWQRHILFLEDSAFIIIDNILPQKEGIFDIRSSWQLGGRINSTRTLSLSATTSNGITLSSSEIPVRKTAKKQVEENYSGYLLENKPFVFANVLTTTISQKLINKVSRTWFLVTGPHTSYVGLGEYSNDGLSIRADFSYFDNKQLFLAGMQEITINGETVIKTEHPVNCLWDLKKNCFTISSSQPCSLLLATESHPAQHRLSEGKHTITQTALRADLRETLFDILKTSKPDPEDFHPAESKAKQEIVDWLPSWKHKVKGVPTIMALTDSQQSSGIWVAIKDKSLNRIAEISATGNMLKKIDCDSEILSLWSAGNQDQAASFALLAGFKDDYLRAYSDNGSKLWSVKTQIHPSFKIGDRYHAPWFTDPGPKHNMTGVSSILVDDFWNQGRQEIALGRPSTIEFHTLQGDLISRVPTRWGKNTSLQLLKHRGNASKSSILLVGKFFTNSPGVTGITSDYSNISNNLCSKIARGYIPMQARSQQGLTHMAVDDIDNNGIDEVIIALSGHWNEVRVYDGSNLNSKSRPLWMHYFGPDKTRSRFMKGLKVLDLDADDRKEIIVGVKSGWLWAFDYRGNILWQRHFTGGISCLDTIGTRGLVTVGLQNGKLLLLDKTGTVIRTGEVKSYIQNILCNAAAVYVTVGNNIFKYSLN